MASQGERESLLKNSGGGGANMQGAYGDNTNTAETSATTTTTGAGATGSGKPAAGSHHQTGSGGANTKRPVARGHLQRNPSMEKVEEEDGDGLAADLQRASAKAREAAASATSGQQQKQHGGLGGAKMKATGVGGVTGCPDYFGVKSYLHHFYDTHFYKDPTIYEDDEDDDFRYLLNPNPRRRRRCTSIWWKVFVWIGANFLVFGIIGVLVGYLVPQRPVVVGSFTDNIEIVDRAAITFNFNLDVCKLVGLILFCVGGLTLTVALLFPSFLYQYCEDDGRDSSFKVRLGDESMTNEGMVGMGGEYEDEPLKSPLEMSIPTTTLVSNVQPERKNAESIVTQSGMVPMND